jgi:hypothetical protein
MEAITMTNVMSGYRGDIVGWVAFLRCWRLAVNKRLQAGDSFNEITLLPSEVNAVNTSLATIDAEVGRAEERLGMRLPKSYVDFCCAVAGRGWFVEALGDIDEDGLSGGLLVIDEIGLFRIVDEHKFNLWFNAEVNEPNPGVYYRYGYQPDPNMRQSSVHFYRQDLAVCIKIGEFAEGVVLLLNPARVTGDGEMEAWVLDSKIPGALRYRSFAEMAQELAHGDGRNTGPGFSLLDELKASCAGLLCTAACPS